MVILLTAVPGKTCREFLHYEKQVPNTEEKTIGHIPNSTILTVYEISVSLPLKQSQK